MEADCLCAGPSGASGCYAYYMIKGGSGCYQTTSFHASVANCTALGYGQCYSTNADCIYALGNLGQTSSCVYNGTTYKSGTKFCKGNEIYRCDSGTATHLDSNCTNGCENGACKTTTTYTCSAKACSSNYGCMRNGVYY